MRTPDLPKALGRGSLPASLRRQAQPISRHQKGSENLGTARNQGCGAETLEPTEPPDTSGRFLNLSVLAELMLGGNVVEARLGTDHLPSGTPEWELGRGQSSTVRASIPKAETLGSAQMLPPAVLGLETRNPGHTAPLLIQVYRKQDHYLQEQKHCF